jgi:hypothetical protein
MQTIDFRLAEIRERQAHLRSIRVAERADGLARRPIRAQLGASIIQLGRRVAGDHVIAPLGTG